MGHSSLLFKWANPGLFFVYFRFFQTNITVFTTNICEKTSIQYLVLGFEPTTFGCESLPITTRPELWPNLFLFFVFSIKLIINVQYKFFTMTGFKLRSSGIRSNRSTNWATTTAQPFFFTRKTFLLRLKTCMLLIEVKIHDIGRPFGIKHILSCK